MTSPHGDAELLDREGYTRDRRLERRVLTFLFVVGVLGFLGFTASVVTALTSRDAAAETAELARQEAARNGDLLRQLRAIEADSALDVEAHRTRNEELHADICRLIYAVVTTAPSLRDAGIQPCRKAEAGAKPNPHPAPTPAPPVPAPSPS